MRANAGGGSATCSTSRQARCPTPRPTPSTPSTASATRRPGASTRRGRRPRRLESLPARRHHQRRVGAPAAEARRGWRPGPLRSGHRLRGLRGRQAGSANLRGGLRSHGRAAVGVPACGATGWTRMRSEPATPGSAASGLTVTMRALDRRTSNGSRALPSCRRWYSSPNAGQRDHRDCMSQPDEPEAPYQ